MKQHLRGWLAGSSWLLVAALGACNSSTAPNTGTGTSPVGGTTPAAPAAGAPSASAAGAATAAAAGTTAPTTGAAGATVGAAGGGAAAAGGSAAPAGGSDMTCGPASTVPGPMLYDMAKGYLLPKMETPMSPCAFGSCHTDKIKKAGLILDLTVTDLKAELVDKPACEAPMLKLVASGGGDAALAKSWLWLKLVAPADASNVLTSNPAWGAPGSCGQMSGQEYGVRMPYGSSDWEDAKKAALKAWICAGAPGPM